MLTPAIRRGTLGLAAAALLLLTALAVAGRADAATIYTCVKTKSGAMRLVGKSTKCKHREKKLSWNTDGPAGKNGTSGTNGTNGTNGSNGTNGTDLTSHTPLPNGQSESGWFAIGGGSSTSGEAAEGISFSQPLEAGLPEGHAVFNTIGETSAHCPGFGHAAAGYLCVYAAEQQQLDFHNIYNFEFDSGSTGPYGFAIYFTIAGAGGFVDGSWTVTAP